MGNQTIRVKANYSGVLTFANICNCLPQFVHLSCTLFCASIYWARELQHFMLKRPLFMMEFSFQFDKFFGSSLAMLISNDLFLELYSRFLEKKALHKTLTSKIHKLAFPFQIQHCCCCVLHLFLCIFLFRSPSRKVFRPYKKLLYLKRRNMIRFHGM